jgi:hypothetical protein
LVFGRLPHPDGPGDRVTTGFGIIGPMSESERRTRAQISAELDGVLPWAAVAGATFGVPEGLSPGYMVQFERAEAAERAEEARKAAEAQDRADARYEAAVWEARQYAVAKGLPWDHTRPFEHVPSVWARADAMFALQDAAARRDDYRAAEAAGLVHLLHQGVPQPQPPSAPGPGASPRAPTAERAGIRDVRTVLRLRRRTVASTRIGTCPLHGVVVGGRCRLDDDGGAGRLVLGEGVGLVLGCRGLACGLCLGGQGVLLSGCGHRYLTGLRGRLPSSERTDRGRQEAHRQPMARTVHRSSAPRTLARIRSTTASRSPEGRGPGARPPTNPHSSAPTLRREWV